MWHPSPIMLTPAHKLKLLMLAQNHAIELRQSLAMVKAVRQPVHPDCVSIVDRLIDANKLIDELKSELHQAA